MSPAVENISGTCAGTWPGAHKEFADAQGVDSLPYTGDPAQESTRVGCGDSSCSCGCDDLLKIQTPPLAIRGVGVGPNLKDNTSYYFCARYSRSLNLREFEIPRDASVPVLLAMFV